MNSKKILIGTGLTLAVLAGSFALAKIKVGTFNNNNNGNAKERRLGKIYLSDSSSSTPRMMIRINSNGKAFLDGTIDSINIATIGSSSSNSRSLVVKSWGGGWTVNVSVDTKLMPGDISRFMKGDFVRVAGSASQNGLIIDATMVRDQTANSREFITFTNNTGKQVNDLHLVFNTAVNITNTGSLPALADNNTKNPKLSGGTLAVGASTQVSVTGESENIRLKKWWWTLDGKKVGKTYEGCRKPNCASQ